MTTPAPLTIRAEASLAEAHHRLRESGDGRLVVVGSRNRVQGLVRHNHAGDGFCNRNARSGRPVPAANSRKHWTIIRERSGSAMTQRDLLVAAGGRAINLGDILTLPPDTHTRWLVIHTEHEPTDPDHGIAIVEPLLTR